MKLLAHTARNVTCKSRPAAVAPDKLRRRSHQEAFCPFGAASYGQAAVGVLASALAGGGIVKLDLPHSPVAPNPSFRLLSALPITPSIVARSLQQIHFDGPSRSPAQHSAIQPALITAVLCLQWLSASAWCLWLFRLRSAASQSFLRVRNQPFALHGKPWLSQAEDSWQLRVLESCAPKVSACRGCLRVLSSQCLLRCGRIRISHFDVDGVPYCEVPPTRSTPTSRFFCANPQMSRR